MQKQLLQTILQYCMPFSFQFIFYDMTNLNELNDEMIIHVGSIIRLFEVGRNDIIKNREDQNDSEKIALNYYDYMLLDLAVFKNNAFGLINVTNGSKQKGSMFCTIPKNESGENLTAMQLRFFFGNERVLINVFKP
jgi:hypothetical protein